MRANAEAFFDPIAERYDDAYDRRSAAGYAVRARMAVAIELLGDGPGHVLDAGMGAARLCAELDSCGWTVSGIDASEEMVRLSRRRLPKAADRLHHGRIQALPFPDDTFDAVVATGVLEYAGVEPALSELARVLRPGGRAVVSYPNPRAFYGIWKTRVFYPAIRAARRLIFDRDRPLPSGAGPVTTEEFRALLAHVGLDLAGWRYTSFLVLPSPIDEFVPRITERLGSILETQSSLCERFATQAVYAATKPWPA